MTQFPHLALLSLILLLTASLRAAGLSLARPFTHGAVLQQGQPLPVWGEAAPGARVTVSFQGHRVSSSADETGHWQILLPALSVSSEPSELVVESGDTLRLEDIVVGEVWCILSDLPLPEAPAEPGQRVFSLSLHSTDTPLQQSTWRAATARPSGAQAFASRLSKELSRTLQTPIGILLLESAPAPLSAWQSPWDASKDPGHAEALTRFATNQASYAQRSAVYREQKQKWEEAEKKASRQGAKSLAWFHKKTPPPIPPESSHAPVEPGLLYNSLQAPVLPYSIKGLLWLHGPRDLANGPLSTQSFKDFLAAQPRLWAVPELPLLVVQTPSLEIPQDPGKRQLAQLRAHMVEAAMSLKASWIPTLDLSPKGVTGSDFLPELTRRTLLVMQGRCYGKTTEAVFPRLAQVETRERHVVLSFSGVDTGLVAHEQVPQAFEFVDQHGKSFPAEARLQGDRIVLQSPRLKEAVTLRYAWQNIANANIFNGSGLPLDAFSITLPPLSGH